MFEIPVDEFSNESSSDNVNTVTTTCKGRTMGQEIAITVIGSVVFAAAIVSVSMAFDEGVKQIQKRRFQRRFRQ